ncbi:MAG: hypothetical protein NTW86_30240 [Candidatus Sumerlaeota bacterium]|nr:hypothetical protein [Candidatus Sumerlaeota bacterium]
MRKQFAHLPLLALWAVAGAYVGRSVAAESHFQAALSLPDASNAQLAELFLAETLNPWHGAAFAAQGRAHLDRQEWEPAVAFTQRALRLRFNLELVKQLGSAYYRFGLDSLRSGNRMIGEECLRKAYEVFAKAALCQPNDKDTLYRLAYLSIQLGRPDWAEDYARQYINCYYASAEIDYVLGQAAEMTNHFRREMHDFHRFVLRGKSETLPEELYQKIDWSEWLLQHDNATRELEKGRITARPAVKVD